MLVGERKISGGAVQQAEKHARRQGLPLCHHVSRSRLFSKALFSAMKPTWCAQLAWWAAGKRAEIVTA